MNALMDKLLNNSKILLAYTIVMLVALILFSMPHAPQVYRAKCFITKADSSSALIVREDGKAYKIKNNGYTKGQNLVVEFSDNGTNDEYDDVVVAVYKK